MPQALILDVSPAPLAVRRASPGGASLKQRNRQPPLQTAARSVPRAHWEFARSLMQRLRRRRQRVLDRVVLVFVQVSTHERFLLELKRIFAFVLIILRRQHAERTALSRASLLRLAVAVDPDRVDLRGFEYRCAPSRGQDGPVSLAARCISGRVPTLWYLCGGLFNCGRVVNEEAPCRCSQCEIADLQRTVLRGLFDEATLLIESALASSVSGTSLNGELSSTTGVGNGALIGESSSCC